MTRSTTTVEKPFRGAFWRIAKPYSGTAPRGETQAKLVRGVKVSNSLCS